MTLAKTAMTNEKYANCGCLESSANAKCGAFHVLYAQAMNF